MKILERIRTRLRYRRLTAAQRLSVDYLIEADRVRKRLEEDADRLDRLVPRLTRRFALLQDELDAGSAKLQHDLDTARQLEKTHGTALEALRGENKILNAEMEALVQANQAHLERHRAETAIQVMRHTMSTKSPEE